MRNPKILLAQEESMIGVTSSSLSEYEVITVTLLEEAKFKILDKDINLFVIGIHFDDSSALELVKCIRESSIHVKTPIILIRALPSPLAKTLRRSVQALSRVYDLSGYLELEESLNPEEDLQSAVKNELLNCATL